MPHTSELSAEDIGRMGFDIYDHLLKGELEPLHPGEVVAIHLESKAYFVAPTMEDASAIARQNYQEGVLFLTRIRHA